MFQSFAGLVYHQRAEGLGLARGHMNDRIARLVPNGTPTEHPRAPLASSFCISCKSSKRTAFEQTGEHAVGDIAGAVPGLGQFV